MPSGSKRICFCPVCDREAFKMRFGRYPGAPRRKRRTSGEVLLAKRKSAA